MPAFIVEILVYVEADSHTDAEALGERAAKQASIATGPRGTKARIENVLVSDVRSADD